MSTSSTRASRHLIQSDLRFSLAIINSAAANKDLGGSVAWLLLSHVQFLSLVAYEVRNFSTKEAEKGLATEPWEHELALAASRHSTKLFNDTKKTQLQLLTEFASNAARDRNWYLENNRVPWLLHLFSALGVLVNDTSVLIYGDRILCTSQSIGFHAGLKPGTSQEETVERARELAAYLSGLPDVDKEDWSDDDYSRHWCPNLVTPKDARYRNLYPAMFPTVPLAEAMSLAILDCDLVALKLMRELVPQSDPLAPTAFKFRFSGIWQIVETLNAIFAPDADFSLSDTMNDDLETLLSSEQIRLLRTRGARDLRNVLVHYGMGSIDPESLDWQDPLLGLPELLLDGVNWRAADQILDDLTAALLSMFRSWTGPFSHTLQEPHE